MNTDSVLSLLWWVAIGLRLRGLLRARLRAAVQLLPREGLEVRAMTSAFPLVYAHCAEVKR